MSAGFREEPRQAEKPPRRLYRSRAQPITDPPAIHLRHLRPDTRRPMRQYAESGTNPALQRVMQGERVFHFPAESATIPANAERAPRNCPRQIKGGVNNPTSYLRIQREDGPKNLTIVRKSMGIHNALSLDPHSVKVLSSRASSLSER